MAEMDHPVLVWVWRSGQPEVNGETGFVECMMSVALKLITKGVAQSSRNDMRIFIPIDDPVAIKNLAAKGVGASSNHPETPKPPSIPVVKPEPVKKVEPAKAEAVKSKTRLTPEQAALLEKKLLDEGGGKIRYVGKK